MTNEPPEQILVVNTPHSRIKAINAKKRQLARLEDLNKKLQEVTEEVKQQRLFLIEAKKAWQITLLIQSDAASGQQIELPSLIEAVVLYERQLIREALRFTGGKVTPAARLLNIGYQSLAYVIGSRHPELVGVRTPVRPRRGWSDARKQAQKEANHDK